MIRQHAIYFIIFLLLASFSFKAQDTLKSKRLQFNIQSALVANNSFTDRENGYTKEPGKPVCFGFNAGAEILLGKNKRFKHVVSLTYDLTNSAYNNFYQFPQWGTPIGNYHVSTATQIQFADINYGVLYNVSKRFQLTALAAINFMIKSTAISNGYYTYANTGYMGQPAYSDSVSVNNNKVTNTRGLYLSLKLRASYCITNYLSVFVLRNINTFGHAPWWMLGIQYYPFKKLR